MRRRQPGVRQLQLFLQHLLHMGRLHRHHTVHRHRITKPLETRSGKMEVQFHKLQALRVILVLLTSNLTVRYFQCTLTSINLSATEVPEKWLLDPAISSKKGILAEVRRTSDGRDWQDSKYDGEKVVIRSVLDTRDSAFQSTAEVNFLSPHVPFDKPVIPVEFLYPVEPERTGDTVIILEDGPRKGEDGKVREADPDLDKWTVSITGTHLIVEIKRRMLVKLHPSG